MGLVTIERLKPEMVLGDDLRDRNGRFLLGKGTKITPKHLKIFQMWGIIEADIEGVDQRDVEESGESEVSRELMEQAADLIRPRFACSDPEHPANRALFRLCVQRYAKELKTAKGKASAKPSSIPVAADMEPVEVSGAKRRELNPAALVSEGVSLCTLPSMVLEINETINRPSSSAKDIANVIGKDISLSVRLLKIVNSAMYGYPSRIDNLSRAVLIVGTRQLGALAMGIKVVTVFKSIPSDLIDMESFLKHGVACGIICRILAGFKNIQNSERLFVSGLIHDIGRLILYNQLPDEARGAIVKARRDSELLYRVEHEIMSCDHSRIGGSLLKKWKLPVSIENVVTHHHAPSRSKDPLEPSLVHLADLMANALGIGSSGECLVPALDQHAWECLGFSPNVLALAVKQIDQLFDEVFHSLTVD